MKKNLYSWIPAILWGLLFVFLSLMPGKQGNFFLFGIPHIDKLAHFGMYAVWAFLVFYAWNKNSSIPSRTLIVYTSIFGTLAGILLEYGQFATSMGRSFEMTDMIANSIGAVAGSFCGMFLRSRDGKRSF